MPLDQQGNRVYLVYKVSLVHKVPWDQMERLGRLENPVCRVCQVPTVPLDTVEKRDPVEARGLWVQPVHKALKDILAHVV